MTQEIIEPLIFICHQEETYETGEYSQEFDGGQFFGQDNEPDEGHQQITC
jgi:hypothetical protein